MRRPRHLSPEEKALWDRVARSADPIDRKASGTLPEPPSSPSPPIRPADPPSKAALPRFRLGENASGKPPLRDLAPTPGEALSAAPLRMDARKHGKMTRGKLVPEARIDLHGMTLAEAHSALIGFVLTSRMAGRRLVLVITGKGRIGRDDLAPLPSREGALRHQVPQWLMLAPLADAVLQIAPAHRRHGGSGALYVYLRRPAG